MTNQKDRCGDVKCPTRKSCGRYVFNKRAITPPGLSYADFNRGEDSAKCRDGWVAIKGEL